MSEPLRSVAAGPADDLDDALAPADGPGRAGLGRGRDGELAVGLGRDVAADDDLAAYGVADRVRPEPPRSWRDHAAAVAESLDLSPRRLVVGLVALVVVGLVGWRVLAPADAAPEVEVPFAGAAGAEGTSGSASPPSSAAGAGGAGSAGAAAAAASGRATGASPAFGPGGGSGAAGGGAAATVPAEVVVHVAGAVRAPGVQRLAGGARVVDAVEAAGGAQSDADLGRINLASPVQDGQQVYVPRVGEAAPASV
ncbi:MAG TPA: SLBB domain-containing protein, partial [Acidimicrobiales bacterium]